MLKIDLVFSYVILINRKRHIEDSSVYLRAIYLPRKYTEKRRFVQSLIPFCVLFSHNQRKIIPNEWMHVALTWSREKKEGILYIDGIIQGIQRVSDGLLNLKKIVIQFSTLGWNETTRLDRHLMRDLLVVDKALSGDEVKYMKDIL